MILIISCDDIGQDYFWNTDNKELFIRKFGTLGYDYGWSLSFSPYDNGIILTGSQQAKINQEKNLWAIKTNSYGIVEWEKSIGGAGNEEGYDVISTSDGGFLFVGYTWSYGNEQQVYVVKTDYYGNILWEKNYGGAMWDVGNSVIELIDGNYAIIGYSNSPGISSGNTDILLIKIDINGNLIYLKSYGNELYPNHEWGTDKIGRAHV